MKRAREYVRQYLPDGLDRKTEREAIALVEAVQCDTLVAAADVVRAVVASETFTKEGFSFVDVDRIVAAIKGLKT